jgi:hypothetical protein
MKPLKRFYNNIDKNAPAWSFAIVLLIISILLVTSGCEKADGDYIKASKGEFVEWHIQTGCYTQIVISGWGTAQCNGNRIQDKIYYPDTIYRMDSWNENRNILGLSYDVWLYTDKGWGFVGIGITKFHNDIILP